MAYCAMLTALPVKEVWWFVERRLLEIKARCQETWETQDIYDACISGEAFLYGGGNDRTFAVVVPRFDASAGKPVLFVWVAWKDKMERGECIELLCEIANGIGADTLAMSSPRKGYRRTGWTALGNTYTREVPKR
jgi:hypothetical protein